MTDDVQEPAPRIVLRAYRSTDLDNLFRLDEICFEAPFRFDHPTMRRFAEAGNAITLVAETGTEGLACSIAGFVIIHVERRMASRRSYVVTLDVAPEARQNGLASRMMDAAERRAAEAGATCVELHVFAQNDPAIRFYEGRGYRQLGVEPEFYGVGLDALVYRKTLK